MTQWSNKAPNPHNNISSISHVSEQYTQVPMFLKNSGVINGSTPKSYSITAPSPIDTKKLMNEIQTFLTIQH